MSRFFPYEVPEDNLCRAPRSTMSEKQTDDHKVIALIPAGTLLTQGMIEAIIGAHKLVGRELTSDEVKRIIDAHCKPPKPRKFWILRKGFKGYAGNYFVRFQHEDGRPLTDVDDFEELIPVEEMRPLKAPPTPSPVKPREWFGEVLSNGDLVVHNNSHSLTFGGEFIKVQEVLPEAKE